MTESDEILTIAEAALAMRCSKKTIERARDRGELIASQLGERGVWRIRRTDLEQWFNERANTSRPRPTRPAAVPSPAQTTRPSPAGSSRRRRRGAGVIQIDPTMGRKTA
jgi:excisionase family DNA binding protein